ncbi:DUF1501 domain-containing protein [Polaromonas sp. CT11-55]|uniref:DUF1501 domain-containing protein n=1 Tax=Polaromonas sp. CT11-55 TaxID=3243045 RepID=UPI0039A4801B
MNRRDLVKAAGAGAMSLAGGRLFAAGSGQPRFLLVFLRGGYDAASLLVPVGSSFYYEARRDIAIPRPSADQNTALPLDVDWGLHPALRESIYPMFQKGEAAFIPFAGTPDTSRSHFETQDSIELGQPLDQSRNYRSGFLNRLAATLRGAEPMAFTDQLPLVFQGTARVPNTALKSIAKPSLDVRQSQIISAMYQNTALASAVNEGFTVRDEVMREMSAEMDAANRNAISAKGFELESRRIARLMKERYSIGFVDVGGWDTHVNQGAGTGYLAGRFDELGRGLAAYASEMGAMWKDTTVVVLSEFGRTFRQNGNRGTDHGHGTVYWVLGGGLRGGKVAGEQLKVDAPSLFQNRDFQVLNDYRAVLGGLMARLYGLGPAQTEQIFAGIKSRDLGLV